MTSPAPIEAAEAGVAAELVNCALIAWKDVSRAADMLEHFGSRELAERMRDNAKRLKAAIDAAFRLALNPRGDGGSDAL